MRNFKFYLKNFGCKVNQYDGRVLSNSLLLMGERVNTPGLADIVIVNTCGVTKPAVSRGRRYVRKIKKKHPQKEVLAVGCAAEKSKKEFVSEGADTASHFKMFTHPERKLDEFRGHTRGFLKIQQGCRGRCAYCSVRDLKKPFYVKLPAQVAGEMKKMYPRHPEIVLCGTNLAFYRRSAHRSDFLLGELIKRIKDMPSVFRWRFSSIPPACLSERNLKILNDDEKFCRHFHIPLQSASGKILRKMKRPYSIKFLENRIKNAIEIFREPSFSYDIMVGFPGESEKDFSHTMEFLRKYPPVRVHVFRYSNVRNIKSFSSRVSETVKRQRMEKVKKVSSELIYRRMHREIGKVRRVVVEKNLSGYTREYLPVKLIQRPLESGEAKVLITGTSKGKLLGEPRERVKFEKNLNMCY